MYLALYVRRLEEGRELCLLSREIFKFTLVIVSSFVLTDSMGFLFSI